MQASRHHRMLDSRADRTAPLNYRRRTCRAVLEFHIVPAAGRATRVVEGEEDVEDDVSGHRPPGSEGHRDRLSMTGGASARTRSKLGFQQRSPCSPTRRPRRPRWCGRRQMRGTKKQAPRPRLKVLMPTSVRAAAVHRAGMPAAYASISSDRTRARTRPPDGTVRTSSSRPVLAEAGSACHAFRWACGTTSATTSRSRRSARSCAAPSTVA